MKYQNNGKLRWITTCVAALALFSNALAADRYYNVTDNYGWNDSLNRAWGATPSSFDENWTSGDAAIIEGITALTINLSANTALSGLTVSGKAITLASEGTHALTFNGGVINLSGANVTLGAGVSLQGDYAKQGGSTLLHENSTRAEAYIGTATIEKGSIYFNNAVGLGLSSNFIINGGGLAARQNALAMGSVVLNDGNLTIGRNNSNNSTSLTVSSLSGDGGVIRAASNTDGLTRSFTVNQSMDTHFKGELGEAAATSWIEFTKEGSGTLELSGKITLKAETKVLGGKLLIHSQETSFTNVSGTSALSVDNALLGGTGMITVTGGDHVVLSNTGHLSAGLEGTAGATTFDLGDGMLDLSAPTESGAVGWLKFDLGGISEPGVSHDQIMLTSGTLNLGVGFGLEAFDFNLLAGFSAGDYLLFDTTGPVMGSLGITAGVIDGHQVELAFSGRGVVLHVAAIPEPSLTSLALSGAMMAGWFALARRRITSPRV